ENVERHVMRVAPAGSDRPRFGFLFGTGVVHGFLAEYYRQGRGEPSPLVAVKTLARAVASTLVQGETIRRMARPFRGSVHVHGRPRASAPDGWTVWDRRDFLAVACGTIEHIGLQFKPFHRYGELPGRFHLLAIHASPLSFVRELPRIHRGQPMRQGKALETLADRALVRSDDGRVAYMIDGDLHEAEGDLELAVGPRVRLVVVR
ncbi:MAG TPA: hypothetical protein VE987_13315, partial [Polyangiaceae bacterium]|nr:hypothetical protein [Polyangiaceae bacterium]